MDAKSLQLPAQGMSDLQASYDHALAGLVKAGSELNRVGTEMDRAEIAFRHAINEYFNQLQFQIDHKDNAIRVLTEQKIGAFESMYSMQDQLAKLRNEKTFVNIENESVLPRGMLQEDFPGNSSPDILCPSPNLSSQYSEIADEVLTAVKVTYQSRFRIEHLVHYPMAQTTQL